MSKNKGKNQNGIHSQATDREILEKYIDLQRSCLTKKEKKEYEYAI